MSRRRFIVAVAVVGLLSAASAAIVVIAIDAYQDLNAPEPIRISDEGLGLFSDDQAPLVEEFNADWDRYRRGSFWIESSVERKRRPDNRVLESTQIYAQLPPDRVIVGQGGTTGMFNGSSVNCAGGQDGARTGCVVGESDADYDEAVESEASARSTYFQADSPAYLLRRDEDGCYRLLMTRPIASPPYGESSTFCFDEATGALVLSVVDRDTTIETTTALDVRTDVTRGEIAALIEEDPG